MEICHASDVPHEHFSSPERGVNDNCWPLYTQSSMIMGYPAMAKDSKLMRNPTLSGRSGTISPLIGPDRDPWRYPAEPREPIRPPIHQQRLPEPCRPSLSLDIICNLAHGANRLDRPWIIPLPPAHRALSLISLFFCAC